MPIVGHLLIPVPVLPAMDTEDGAIAGRRRVGNAPAGAQDEQVGTKLGEPVVHDCLKHSNFVSDRCESRQWTIVLRTQEPGES